MQATCMTTVAPVGSHAPRTMPMTPTHNNLDEQFNIGIVLGLQFSDGYS